MEDFNDLNPPQSEAVFSTEKRTCVIAGPGCGKTKTLIARVIFLLKNKKIKPQTILLLTFSKKAIREIKERISKQLGKGFAFQLNIHNFHSFCYKLLHENSSLFGFQKDFLVYDRNDQEALVKRILRQRSQTLVGRDFSDLMNNISLSKLRKNYSEILRNSNHEDFLVYEDYQKLLSEEGALDFNDLLLHVLNGLKNRRVLGEVTSRFTNILIDEFQDVNDIQWEIVNLLTSNNETEIFLVGDPNQSIYGFQGSSPDLISSLIGNDDWKKFFLNINYRSTRKIVRLSNMFIKENYNSLVFNLLETENQEGVPVEIIKNCPPRFIVRKILYLIENQNVKLNSIALIYRNNYLSSFIEQELIFHNIPYEILGSFKFIEREEIKDILAYLKVIGFQNQSNTSLLRILKGLEGIGHRTIENIEIISKKNNSGIFAYLNKEFSSLSQSEVESLRMSKLQKKSLSKIIDLLNRWTKRLEEKGSLSVLINDLLWELDYFEKLRRKTNPLQRKKNVQRFLDLIRTWEKERVSSKDEFLYDILSDFLHYCSISFEDSNLQTERNNLILSSIHQVKGLEFDYVFFLYLDHNILPHKNSLDLTEEKRIFYVGITRAKRSLHLISNGNIPSTFLDFLLEENH